MLSKDKHIVSNGSWILNDSNYQGWKQVMMANLDFRGLWPAVQHPVMSEDKEMIQKDKEALFILKSSIEAQQLDRTGVCSSAHELWRKLQENYEGSKSSVMGSVAAAWAVFGSQPGEDLISYCGRFETLLAKLRAVSYEVPEDQKFLFFIRSLPKQRQEFCYTFRMVNPYSTVDELVSAVKSRFHTDLMLETSTKGNEPMVLLNGPVRSKYQGKAKRNEKEEKLITDKKSDKKSFKKKNFKCNFCNEEGHKWRFCKKLTEKMVAESSKIDKPSVEKKTESKDEKLNIFMAIEDPMMFMGKREYWVADSGASCHVTPYKEIISNYIEFATPKKLLTGGKTRLAKGSGLVYYNNESGGGYLKDVLYIPEFPTNIFSLDRAINLGYDVYVNGRDKTVEIIDLLDKKSLLKGKKIGQSLLCFKLDPITRPAGEAFPSCFMAEDEELHLRWAHLPVKEIRRMMDNNMVKNATLSTRKTDPCLDCLMGKACKVPHPSVGRIIADKDATILHFDTFDATKRSISGNLYMVVAVDEFSNYRFATPVADKVEIRNVVKTIIKQVELESKRMVARIVTDQGSEFMNADLRSWVAENGIGHVVSTAYTPQQNGVAERAVRAIKEAGTTQLLNSGLPAILWDESAMAATYALNRAPSPRDHLKTRYELYWGEVPDVSNLRVFGQFIMVRMNDPKITKWAKKAGLARFVSYTSLHNTYRVYFEEQGIVKQVCNVRFLPMDFRPDLELIEEQDEALEIDMGTETSRSRHQDSHQYAEIGETLRDPMNINDRIHQEISEFTSGNLNVPPAKRTRFKSRNMQPIFQQLPYIGRALLTVEKVDLNLFTLEGEPENIEEAQSREDWPQWKEAMNREISSLEENKTWEIVTKPDNAKIIKSKWVFTLKHKPDGTIDRYKARLVAKGYTQVKGLDFNETFSPVTSLTIVRLLIALACQLSMRMFQFDVTTAFLHGDLDEEIYLGLPEGCDYPEGTVCKLKKSLYGLKQSPRNWNRKIDQFLNEFNLKKSRIDECFYYTEDKTMMLALYVDDALVAVSEDRMFKKLVQFLSNTMKITAKPVDQFLGMKIDVAENKVTISQQSYIERMLARFGLENSNPTSTPEECGTIDYDSFSPVDQEYPFKEVVGSLLYLSCASRPDITHAVNMASRTGRPTIAHHALIKRILKYLNGTKGLGITYEKRSNPCLVGYSDADFANDLNTRKSTSGLLITYGEGPIWWKTTRQPIVALSTTEAEFISGCEITKELIPIRELLLELKVIPEEPTKLKIDNQSAIKLSDNTISRQRTKHIDVRSRWLSEQVALKTIKVEHISGTDQKADILTKPLRKCRFASLRSIVLNSLTILCLLVRLIMSDNSFNKVNPVYFHPTSMPYLNGTLDYSYVVKMVNPCKPYFGDLFTNKKLNENLVKDCDEWLYDRTVSKMKFCSSRMPTKQTQMVTNKIAKTVRHKRVVPLLLIGYTVVSGAATYTAIRKVDSFTENVKILKESIEGDRKTIVKTYQALNATRDAIRELGQRQIELEKKVAYINETVEGFPRAMALIAETFRYFDHLETVLKDIDDGFNKGKMSLKLQELANTTLWAEPAEQWSEMTECFYELNREYIELSVAFSVPEIDTRVEILEATAFKFWNQTAPNKFCRMKYAGPRYVLTNHTNKCYLHIESDWLHKDALEGHPCLNEQGVPGANLNEISFPFHAETCVNKLVASTLDIQIKRLNGFIRIYCLGHLIKLDTEQECPAYIFELAATDYFCLNGHENRQSSRKGVLVDPHEIVVNREISKKLKLDKIKIKVFNHTTLNEKLEALGDAISTYGQNITLAKISGGFLINPFEGLTSVLTDLWNYLQQGFLVVITIMGACILIIVSPAINIIVSILNRVFKVIARTCKTGRRDKIKNPNYYV